ncbi:hypothetical protein MAPG_09358 [Magnaporthiopsis poae ATCC 64411]|uniref:GLEYA adhesin domain-containing protein n=1 Tax=Magnaporthiopsis poae (strain ATCC 64411 / 73-15) TaxID=644358 RepID=A0A0C4E9R0_MAGP6|nr:hypothetical protein MAPG_09358 [Magnaporthiopsis poae ATCC 64411]
MQVLALGLAALPGVLANVVTTACNADNCARDVTGTRAGKLPIETRKADCSNFMTSTVYATPTATSTPAIVYNRKMKRDPVTVQGTMPAYVSQCAGTSAYSSVCSCWGYTAGVTTVTTPTTTVVAPAATCTKGLEWAYYALEQGSGPGQVPVNPANGPYSNVFDAGTIKGLTPFSTGTSKRITFGATPNGGPGCNGGNAFVDGVEQAPGSHNDYAVLQHRGYIMADQTGIYKATAGADEMVLGWFGASAVSGWTTANAQLKAGYGFGTSQYTFTATAGDVIPFRVLFVNAQGCYYLGFTLTRPDNSVLVTNTANTDTSSIIQHCSGAPMEAKAPSWPAFSAEQ